MILLKFLAMNVADREGVAFARSDEMKNHRNLFLRRVDELFSEFDIDMLELSKTKKMITDRIPGKCLTFVFYL